MGFPEKNYQNVAQLRHRKVWDRHIGDLIQFTSQQSQMYQIVQFAIKRGLEKPDFSSFLIGQSWTRVWKARDVIKPKSVASKARH